MEGKNRIVCIGNRFFLEDAAGPRVFDFLKKREIPQTIEVIDGGLCGMDLLPLADDARRLVFVDSVSGFSQEREKNGHPEDARPDSVLLLSPRDILEGEPVPYGHHSGLASFLRALPLVCEKEPPEVHIVGLEQPVNDDSIEKAAALCLCLAGAP